jgi:hypothetical protein
MREVEGGGILEVAANARPASQKRGRTPTGFTIGSLYQK